MRTIALCDATLRGTENRLSFREKIEAAKLLDKLRVDAVELAPIQDTRTDVLLIKSLATVLKYAAVSVPAALSEEGVDEACNALRHAERRRVRIEVPMSTVRMEYVCHKKPPMVLAMTDILVKRAAAFPKMEVEFVADDATRADFDFLCQALNTAVAGGAAIVTLCDSEGFMLPEELGAFVKKVLEAVPALAGLPVHVQCGNGLDMACACGATALRAGAAGLKVSACDAAYPLLEPMVHILHRRGADWGMEIGLDPTRITRTVEQVGWMLKQEKSKTSPFENGVRAYDGQGVLDINDSDEAVTAAVRKLGYELSEEDNRAVVEAFRHIADKKTVSYRELDAIVAGNAMQVPSTYRLESYVVNASNVIGATAHVILTKGEEKLESVVIGDGPVDASFLAVEQIAGQHYELDDFQIQAVTEGREAMGSAMIRLRSGGKLYAGRGISTDIICACIRAYLNALNRIVYEEAQA